MAKFLLSDLLQQDRFGLGNKSQYEAFFQELFETVPPSTFPQRLRVSFLRDAICLFELPTVAIKQVVRGTRPRHRLGGHPLYFPVTNYPESYLRLLFQSFRNDLTKVGFRIEFKDALHEALLPWLGALSVTRSDYTLQFNYVQIAEAICRRNFYTEDDYYSSEFRFQMWSRCQEYPNQFPRDGGFLTDETLSRIDLDRWLSAFHNIEDWLHSMTFRQCLDLFYNMEWWLHIYDRLTPGRRFLVILDRLTVRHKGKYFSVIWELANCDAVSLLLPQPGYPPAKFDLSGYDEDVLAMLLKHPNVYLRLGRRDYNRSEITWWLSLPCPQTEWGAYCKSWQRVIKL